MNLKEKIMEDLKIAMKTKDTIKLSVLRAIKSAILMHETDKNAMELDAAGEVKLLQKLVKQRRESAEIYAQQNRSDLAETERLEADIISEYLPKMLDEDEIGKIISGIIQSVGAKDMKDMGKVMGAAQKQLAGKADGKMISDCVKRLLNN
jgi:uncharacterized protein